MIITHLITKGPILATINGDDIVCWEGHGSGQDTLVIYQYPVGEEITAMVCRSKPTSKFILGYVKFVIITIIV